ncbi:unnamed protein product [Caenorhabditis auriculariae]|uniref:Uncharacterized protein n=1 Tax=Caenorhabditis auriculariae TaxID=2777116 RepID=A0A8S1GX59_9PELO|nr:unnamed protein product [Caenorhabditis auriculariae]
MFRALLLVALLASISLQQQQNYDSAQPDALQAAQQAGYDVFGIPGFLPDYEGDKYTTSSRRQDTHTLNEPFLDSIGGAPDAPPPTPSQTPDVLIADYASHPKASTGNARPDDEELLSFQLTPSNDDATSVVYKVVEGSEAGDAAYISEATRAIIEALTKSDPNYIGQEFIVSFFR